MNYETKCVFDRNHLGKQYRANAIQQRCSTDQETFSKQQSLHPLSAFETEDSNKIKTDLSKMLDDLLQPENNQYVNEPLEQQKFKKRRKRKQQQSP